MDGTKRIGLMGGTFNPVHIGHLMLAEWALDALRLDEVWFIPAGTPYMKQSQEGLASAFAVPAMERLRMTELAIKENPFFRCLDLEVMRQGRTYSYETLMHLKSCYPDTSFFFIMGTDCLFALENWKNPEKIFQCCTIAAAVRGEACMTELERKKAELEQRFQGEIVLLPFISMQLSSTEIRQRVMEGKSIRYLTSDSVIDYIREKGFYCEKSGEFKKA